LGVLGLIQYAQAYVVHLVQQVEVDGAIVETIDQMVETGDGYTTSNATDRAGYIFTHWSTSTVQEFNNRDYWGRAYEQVAFSLYEPMTVTAHYVREDLDEDADGVPDGVEVYEIDGPYFFGVANKFDEVMQDVAETPKVRVIRMRKVPFIDSTGLHNLENLCLQSKKAGITIILSGVRKNVEHTLLKAKMDVLIGKENICPNINVALEKAAEHVK
jgi:anti-anti-sigma factor